MISFEILIIPGCLYLALSLVDQLRFHGGRHLNRNEAKTHCLSTFFVLLATLPLIAFPPSQGVLILFLLASTAGALFILLDESSHLSKISVHEGHLHGALHMLYPLAMVSLLSFWPFIHPKLPFYIGLIAPDLVSNPQLALLALGTFSVGQLLILGLQVRQLLATIGSQP